MTEFKFKKGDKVKIDEEGSSNTEGIIFSTAIPQEGMENRYFVDTNDCITIYSERELEKIEE